MGNSDHGTTKGISFGGKLIQTWYNELEEPSYYRMCTTFTTGCLHFGSLKGAFSFKRYESKDRCWCDAPEFTNAPAPPFPASGVQMWLRQVPKLGERWYLTQPYFKSNIGKGGRRFIRSQTGCNSRPLRTLAATRLQFQIRKRI